MIRMNQRAEDYLAWVRRNIREILLGLVVLLILATSVKTVKPEEEGVVLFLGKYTRKVNPGLSFIAPLGVEKMYKIPVQRQLKLEFGFRTLVPGVRTVYSGAFIYSP